MSVSAQKRDPFLKPAWAQPKSALPTIVPPKSAAGATSSASTSSGPSTVGAPSIESRIEYYKRMRAIAAGNGTPIPKVTSVLTLSEMVVNGIFKTPRGYAAIVEATPIKLAYTVYPGEKFFDGQLVAIEENRLVFRKVTKLSSGKFVSFEENKPLRQYTVKEEVQGTAPTSAPQGDRTEASVSQDPSAGAKPLSPTSFVSPLEEMNRQPAKSAEESSKSKDGKSNSSSKRKPVAKKSVKVAENNKE